MPTSRLSHSDTRQRRSWQKFATGLWLTAPFYMDDAGDMHLSLADPGGLEVNGSDELTVIVGDGLEIVAAGIQVDLAADPGLEFTGGDLIAKVGDGLELVAAGIQVDLSASPYLEFSAGDLQVVEAVVTRTRTIYIEDPQDGDAYPIGFTEQAMTISEIHGVTDAGTFTFNIEHRAKTTPFAAGTEIADASDVVADTNGQAQSGWNDATIPADRLLYFVAMSHTGTPTKLMVTIEQKLDA